MTSFVKLQGHTDLKYELACDSATFEAVDFQDVLQLVILKQFHTAILYLRYNILVFEAIQQHLLIKSTVTRGHTLAVSALSLCRYIMHLALVEVVGLKPVTLHKGVFCSFCLPLLSCHCYCLVFTCRLRGSINAPT